MAGHGHLHAANSVNAWDPNTWDAVLARVLSRLDDQDKETLRFQNESREYREDQKRLMMDVQTKVTHTNGRVTALEKWRYTMGGAILAIATIVGWFVALKGH